MRRALVVLLVLAGIYVGSYAALSAAGEYAPMGTKRVWCPLGFDYRIVLDGFGFGVRLNPIARFYLPLLMLDLRWWHPDRSVLGAAPLRPAGPTPGLCRGSPSPAAPTTAWADGLRPSYPPTTPRRPPHRCATGPLSMAMVG